MVRRLFTHWQLSPAEQADLLGQGSMSRDDANRSLEGDTACVNPDVEVRVGHLLAIHRLLRLLFPQNRDLAYQWFSAPNKKFGDRKPVDVVREQGVEGLRLVRSYLSDAAGRSGSSAGIAVVRR